MAANFLRDIIAGAIVLGVLVLLHEWGHFVAAKLCGVRVDVFSIGFGTRLFGWKRGDTDYRVSALPLGGYVRMAGDNPTEERTGAEYEFLSRPRWQRFLIAIAGPFMNIMATLLILWGIFTFKGIPFPLPVIDQVTAGSPAAAAGLQSGDRVLIVNGTAITSWNDLVDDIRGSNGQPLNLTLQRDGKQIPVVITPTHMKDGQGQTAWMIGASRTAAENFVRQSPPMAAKEAVVETIAATKQIGGVLTGLF